jgi:hypothetical protein
LVQFLDEFVQQEKLFVEEGIIDEGTSGTKQDMGYEKAAGEVDCSTKCRWGQDKNKRKKHRW